MLSIIAMPINVSHYYNTVLFMYTDAFKDAEDVIGEVLTKVSDPASVEFVSTADNLLQNVDMCLEEVEDVAAKFSDDSSGEFIMLRSV